MGFVLLLMLIVITIPFIVLTVLSIISVLKYKPTLLKVSGVINLLFVAAGIYIVFGARYFEEFNTSGYQDVYHFFNWYICILSAILLVFSIVQFYKLIKRIS